MKKNALVGTKMTKHFVPIKSGDKGCSEPRSLDGLKNRSSKHLPVLYGRHAIKPQFYSLVIIIFNVFYQVFDEGVC